MQYAPISIIIPCYNCADTITRAVQSIIKQNMLPKELILVNDCSSDDGQTVAHVYELQNKYKEKFEIIVIDLEENHGAASARNRGWKVATQPYIAFLDADDAWHPEKIKIQYTWMINHPDAVLTGHNYKQVAQLDEKSINDKVNFYDVKKISKQALLFKNCFPTPSVMIKRDLQCRFMDKKRYSEDYLLWLQVAWCEGNVYLLEYPLVFIFKADYGEGGLSAQLWQMEKGELETYDILFKQQKLNGFLLKCIQVLSLFKYCKRLMKVYSCKILK
jgi:glycosyltransferase involved in cell wall biosynthesis